MYITIVAVSKLELNNSALQVMTNLVTTGIMKKFGD